MLNETEFELLNKEKYDGKENETCLAHRRMHAHIIRRRRILRLQREVEHSHRQVVMRPSPAKRVLFRQRGRAESFRGESDRVCQGIVSRVFKR